MQLTAEQHMIIPVSPTFDLWRVFLPFLYVFVSGLSCLMSFFSVWSFFCNFFIIMYIIVFEDELFWISRTVDEMIVAKSGKNHHHQEQGQHVSPTICKSTSECERDVQTASRR